ncbi:MAG TPA: HD domain-containing protein [Candidatus Hydrogenedentes bacterium]|nr:HD domain-containing protein [Candidatus Hydrogenedentota bacterium]HRK33987.1 HD domain-containing protein [Candidatus Hydrogenedentota bacterium]
MQTSTPYSTRIVNAFALAHRVHADQVRRGSGVPYITHVMAVAGIVGEHGADEDTFIAALLHDAAEDGGGHETLAEIRAEFGDRVADFVAACSDTCETPKPAWRERKERYIASLRNAPDEVRLIVAADKLHNICATTNDFYAHGEAVWERFNGGRDGTLWYYIAITDALAQGWNHELIEDLTAAVEDLVESVDAE